MKERRLETAPRRGAAMTLVEVMVIISIIAILSGLVINVAGRASKNARRNEARALLQAVVAIADQYKALTRGSLDSCGWVVNHSREAVLPNGQMVPIDWDEPMPDHLRSETNVAPDDPYNADKSIALKRGSKQDDPGRTGDLSREPASMLPAFEGENGGSGSSDEKQQHVTIERFVWAIFQLPETREMLENLGTKYLADTDGDDFIEIIDPWGKPLFYAAYVDHDDAAKVDEFLLERKTWGDEGRYGPANHRSQWRAVFVSAGEDRLWGRARVRKEFPSDDAYNTYRNTDEYKRTIDNLHSDDDPNVTDRAQEQ